MKDLDMWFSEKICNRLAGITDSEERREYIEIITSAPGIKEECFEIIHDLMKSSLPHDEKFLFMGALLDEYDFDDLLYDIRKRFREC